MGRGKKKPLRDARNKNKTGAIAISHSYFGDINRIIL